MNIRPGLRQGEVKFFCKGLDNKYFQLVGHMVSVVPTQLYCYSAKAATDSRKHMGVAMFQ